MYRKKLNFKQFILLILVVALPITLKAQLSLSAQLRTRSEYRNGQGSPLKQGDLPSFFTSQRTRLMVNYAGYRLKFGLIAQDVRVWGQDASTINRSTNQDFNGMMLHEAWTEISLIDTGKTIKDFSLKIGRQELVYDDVRLLGNLDWLQQARRHDLALLKFGHNGWTAHVGLAFNQNKELKTGSVFNGVPVGYAAGTNGLGTNYKTMAFLYLAKKIKTGHLSFLLLNDNFNKYVINQGSKTYENGVWGRLTYGLYANFMVKEKLNLTTAIYAQSGKDKDGKELNAYMYSALGMYAFNKKISAGAGVDFLSGSNPSASTNHTFDPLYGTPHKFWGLMDYFYVADGFGKGGLANYYLKTRYKANEKFNLTLDIHQFSSATTILASDNKELSKNLGMEIDVVGTYQLTKHIGFEGGFCMFLAKESLNTQSVKNIPNAQNNNTWGYLMVNIRPELFTTTIKK